MNNFYKALYFFVLTLAVLGLCFDRAVNWRTQTVVGAVKTLVKAQDKAIDIRLGVESAQRKMLADDLNAVKAKLPAEVKKG